MSTLLHSEIPFGRIQLRNRVIMAPMTRSRAVGNVPNEIMARYYRQRADAGLIITEGTSPSPNGLGYARIPGLFNAEQVKGWRPVTDAVHQAGGKIFVQLMHTGRASHPANLPADGRTLAPSAIGLTGTIYTDSQGPQPYPVPKAMTADEVEAAIAEFVHSSRLAIEAGFDGVELHGANGYLIDQFLNSASNHRTDQWGGSIENRIRFPLEIARRVSEAIGPDRVGIRISPYGVFNDMKPDAEMDAMYERLTRELNQLGIVYIHVVDHSSMGAPEVSPTLKRKIRQQFRGHYILSGGYDAQRAEVDLAEKKGDVVAFGRPFISNPDLVAKLREGKPLATADPGTFYTPGEKGYTDYA
ncbi:MAG: alkene reductase [Bacteriovoracia bacterium]